MPLEFVGCIGGCDETLKEILGLRFHGVLLEAASPLATCRLASL